MQRNCSKKDSKVRVMICLKIQFRYFWFLCFSRKQIRSADEKLIEGNIIATYKIPHAVYKILALVWEARQNVNIAHQGCFLSLSKGPIMPLAVNTCETNKQMNWSFSSEDEDIVSHLFGVHRFFRLRSFSIAKQYIPTAEMLIMHRISISPLFLRCTLSQ